MKLSLFILISFIYTSTFSQDGSDIIYIKPKQLNDSHIDKICHIDFGLKSFRGINIDTLKLNVNGEILNFIEHRIDNGYDNWFNEQYLECQTSKNTSIRITYSKIDSLTTKKVYVSSILSYYRYNSPLDTITQIHHNFFKKNIAEILIKSKN